MQEQDKRAVESMCRCGLDLEGVINVFPSFPREEIMVLRFFTIRGTGIGEEEFSVCCSLFEKTYGCGYG